MVRLVFCMTLYNPHIRELSVHIFKKWDSSMRILQSELDEGIYVPVAIVHFVLHLRVFSVVDVLWIV